MKFNLGWFDQYLFISPLYWDGAEPGGIETSYEAPKNHGMDVGASDRTTYKNHQNHIDDGIAKIDKFGISQKGGNKDFWTSNSLNQRTGDDPLTNAKRLRTKAGRRF